MKQYTEKYHLKILHSDAHTHTLYIQSTHSGVTSLCI